MKAPLYQQSVRGENTQKPHYHTCLHALLMGKKNSNQNETELTVFLLTKSTSLILYLCLRQTFYAYTETHFFVTLSTHLKHHFNCGMSLVLVGKLKEIPRVIIRAQTNTHGSGYVCFNFRMTKEQPFPPQQCTENR